jgi:hypothetical protein
MEMRQSADQTVGEPETARAYGIRHLPVADELFRDDTGGPSFESLFEVCCRAVWRSHTCVLVSHANCHTSDIYRVDEVLA